MLEAVGIAAETVALGFLIFELWRCMKLLAIERLHAECQSERAEKFKRIADDLQDKYTLLEETQRIPLTPKPVKADTTAIRARSSGDVRRTFEKMVGEKPNAN